MPRKQALKSYYTNDAGLELDDIELLKKIKNMKDSCREEVKKIKKSMQSGIDYRYIEIKQIHKKHNGGNNQVGIIG